MENLYDELSKKATASATVPRRGRHSHGGGAAGNGNSATGSVSTSATAHPGGGGEYSMEKIKMSYDKLDFSRPAENLKPHYHSSSTLRSSKSKEFTHTTPKAIGDQESLTASNEPMVGSGYTPIAILNDPSARKCSSGHLSQAAIPQVSICTVGTVNETVFFIYLSCRGIMHLMASCIWFFRTIRLLSAVLPTIMHDALAPYMEQQHH